MTPIRVAIAGYLVLLIAIIGSSFEIDHLSCARSNQIRSSLRISAYSSLHRLSIRLTIDKGVARSLDLGSITATTQAIARIPTLDCTALFPIS